MPGSSRTRESDLDVTKHNRRDTIQNNNMRRERLTGFSQTAPPKTLGGNFGNGSGGTGTIADPIILAETDHGTVNTTLDIELSPTGGNFHRAIFDGATTITFNSPPTSGQIERFVFQFQQDGVGGHTITLPLNIVNTPTIGTGAAELTIVEFYTFDNGASYYAINVAGGAGGAAANWSLFPALAAVDMANFGFINYEGWTADPGQTQSVGVTGIVNTLPAGDTYSYNINGVPQLIITEGTIDVENNSLVDYIGWIAGPGQTQAVGGSGVVNTLPLGDSYLWQINGTSLMELTSIGLGMTQDIFMNNNPILQIDNLGFFQGHNINGDISGLTYNVVAGDTHDFQVDSFSKLIVGDTTTTITNTLSMLNNNIINLANPINPQDAATKAYVDSVASGGGANTSLSNLTLTSINQNLTPNADNARDLGQPGIEWRHLYIDGIANIDTINMDGGNIDMGGGLIDDISGLFSSISSQQNIQWDAGGSIHNVPNGDIHRFLVDGNQVMSLEENNVFIEETLNLLGNDIESFTSVPFIIGGNETLRITSTELRMAAGHIIDFGTNISISANGGAFSPPATVAGYINIQVNGADARIAYYNV